MKQNKLIGLHGAGFPKGPERFLIVRRTPLASLFLFIRKTIKMKNKKKSTEIFIDEKVYYVTTKTAKAVKKYVTKGKEAFNSEKVDELDEALTESEIGYHLMEYRHKELLKDHEELKNTYSEKVKNLELNLESKEHDYMFVQQGYKELIDEHEKLKHLYLAEGIKHTENKRAKNANDDEIKFLEIIASFRFDLFSDIKFVKATLENLFYAYSESQVPETSTVEERQHLVYNYKLIHKLLDGIYELEKMQDEE